jgi:sugar (pentulose or hexulose) kinase
VTLIVIGIDGGGSKTRAMVADEHGGMIGDVVGLRERARAEVDPEPDADHEEQRELQDDRHAAADDRHLRVLQRP